MTGGGEGARPLWGHISEGRLVRLGLPEFVEIEQQPSPERRGEEEVMGGASAKSCPMDSMKVETDIDVTGPVWALDALRSIHDAAGGLVFRVCAPEAPTLVEKDPFKFDVGEAVSIIPVGTISESTQVERGLVIGRAEFSASEPQYQVRYRCGDGRIVESWWTQGALEAG